MPWQPLQVTIDARPDIMADDLDQLSRTLRADLLDLDVIAVDHADTAAPAGSMTASGIDVARWS